MHACFMQSRVIPRETEGVFGTRIRFHRGMFRFEVYLITSCVRDIDKYILPCGSSVG